MKHILLFMAFVSTCFGFGLSIAVVFLFANDKKKMTKYYLLLLIPLSILAFFHTLHLYININLTRYSLNAYFNIFNKLFYPTIRSFFMYLIPQFFYNFSGIIFTKKRKIFFALISTFSFFIVLLFLIFFNEYLIFILRVHVLLTSLIFLYFFVIAAFRVKKIKTTNNWFVVKNKIFINFSIGLFIFIFIVFLVTLFFYILKNNSTKNYLFYLRNISFFTIFFILNAINILFILLGYKFPKKQIIPTKFSISHRFIEEYHITSRELDIIKLILMGKSNKEISGILFRSPKTIQNHIYNIYQKTGASSRMHLNNIINTM